MALRGFKFREKESLDMHYVLDIEVFDLHDKSLHWAQAKYLVHGYKDILWTNDLDLAMEFLKESLMELGKE